MTREEQIQDACKTSIKETIACSGWGFTDRATDLLECAFEKGARWADKTLIDKACEWLIENYPTPDGGELYIFIKDFRKAMEE